MTPDHKYNAMTSFLDRIRHLAIQRGHYNLEQHDIETDSITARDLESFMARYAHGECHALTYAILQDHYQLTGETVPYCLITLKQDSAIIHSCLPLNDTLMFDAYGLINHADLVYRYGHMGRFTLEHHTDRASLYDSASLDPDDIEDAIAALRYIVNLFHFT
jgi:hypothetical protein